MTPTASDVFNGASYDLSKDRIFTYVPTRTYGAAQKEDAKKFLATCQRELRKGNEEDMRTLRQAMHLFRGYGERVFGREDPVKIVAVINPFGRLKGGNVRIYPLSEEEKESTRIGILEDMHLILTEFGIGHPDLAKLYSSRSYEEITAMRNKLTKDLTESIDIIYKKGLLGSVAPDVMTSENGLFVVLPELPHDIGELSDEQSLEQSLILNSKYKALIEALK